MSSWNSHFWLVKVIKEAGRWFAVPPWRIDRWENFLFITVA